MMRSRAVIWLLAAVITASGLSVPAYAGCRWVDRGYWDAGLYYQRLEWVCDGDEGGGDGGGDPGNPGPRKSEWDPECVRRALELGQNAFRRCGIPYDAPPDEVEEFLTPGMVASAIAAYEMPAAEMVMEPPAGETLVNLDSNFYTEAGPFGVDFTILGLAVAVQFTPQEYQWVFGDGATLGTDSPGAPYPDLEVTHQYLVEGEYLARVDVEYTATYQVEGGPVQQVPGSVVATGSELPLTVVEAAPRLNR